MSDLPYSDPSNPALLSPLFSDLTAVRGDHMRANNAAIFANFDFLIDLFNEFFTDSDQLTVDEILEKTSGAGVTIDGVLCKDGVVTGDVVGNVTGNADTADGVNETGSGACVVRKMIVEIGAWNMDSISTLYVACDLESDQIRSYQVFIISDNLYGPYNLSFGLGNDSSIKGGACFDAANYRFVLNRVAGAFFDSTDFDATSFNRGWITIEYVD